MKIIAKILGNILTVLGILMIAFYILTGSFFYIKAIVEFFH